MKFLRTNPRVNRRECCGCALCAYALPGVFRVSPEGKSEVFAPDKAPREKIQKIMDDCPCMAILWYKQGS